MPANLRALIKPLRLSVFSASLLLSACSTQQIGKAIEEGQTTAGTENKVIDLNQGWTEDTQQAFYFTTQGSRIIPYAWYLHLEQAQSSLPFRDDANIARLNYLPSQKSEWNPDGLAVGFTKYEDENQQTWMGFNCAACHTAQISYKGQAIRIDGGPSLGDFQTFNQSLVAALNATLDSNEKFDRFAKNILGEHPTSNQTANLRNALLAQTEILAKRNQVNHADPTQPDYGYGRVDAIGAIFNQVLTVFADLPDNGRPSNAPVSYPFLWGTHQSDVVQWTGFAPNGPVSLGALIRNGGEVLGVYGQLEVPEDRKKTRYQSSLAIENLGLLEQWVAELRSPRWPNEIFPAIDAIKAAKGEVHYQAHCAACHQVIPAEDEGKPYKAVLTPLAEVKTDPQEIINMLAKRPAGRFSGRKEFGLGGTEIQAQTTGLEPLVNAVVGALLEHPAETVVAGIEEFKGGVAAASPDDGIALKPSAENLSKLVAEYTALREALNAPTNGNSTDSPLAVYKARPLNGIWATAPYLHNGSVPNLYEILVPAAERSEIFYLGSRQFDPIHIGYVSDKKLIDSALNKNASANKKAFKYDTTQIGNSNSGHEYGTSLSETQRYELLEYMKTL